MSKDNLKPGSLAVLFNPTLEHVRNLIELKDLCAVVVAIDNSTHVNLELQQKIQSCGIDVIVNRNQSGIAGAFNKGIERLLGLQCDLLFTFDQDSAVPKDYFIETIKAVKQLDSPLFLIGPKIFDINVNRYIPLLVMKPFNVSFTPMTSENLGLLPCSSIISSGAVMSAETYCMVGPFREDYFIDQVDTEYCFRAIAKGVPVYINTALTLLHEIGKRIDRKIWFFNFIQWNYPPIRQYYSARNCIHLARSYGSRLPSALLINLITLGQFLSIIRYETDKLRKLSAMCIGALDGLLGRYGPMEVCQPRISALCSSKPTQRRPDPLSQRSTQTL